MTTPAKPFAGRLRAALIAASLMAPLVLLGALSAAQEQPDPAKETAKQKYKNIKVLKDLPAGALIPMMRKWNAALGVKCDYCHVIGENHTGFEKDDKPEKETARKMVLMTVELNKRVRAVKNKVTCNMCHRGHHEPEMDQEEGERK